MYRDPVVEEVRKARREIVEQAGNDLHRLCEMLRAREGKLPTPSPPAKKTRPHPKDAD